MSCMSHHRIQSSMCMCSRSRASQKRKKHGRCNRRWCRASECTSGSQCSTSRMSCMSHHRIQSSMCMCSRSRASQKRKKHGRCNQWRWCRASECTSGSQCSTSRMSCMSPHRIQSNTCMCSRLYSSKARKKHGRCNQWRWCRASECTSGSQCSTSRMSCMSHHRIQSNTCMCSRLYSSKARKKHGRCNQWRWCRASECTSGSQCSTSHMSCMSHHRIQSSTCMCMMRRRCRIHSQRTMRSSLRLCIKATRRQ